MSDLQITTISKTAISAAREARAQGGASPKGRQTLSEGGNNLPQFGDAMEETGKSVVPKQREAKAVVQNTHTDLQFQASESTHSAVITVHDTETGKLIRQIPSKEMIAIAEYIAQQRPEPSSGTVVDDKE